MMRAELPFRQCGSLPRATSRQFPAGATKSRSSVVARGITRACVLAHSRPFVQSYNFGCFDSIFYRSGALMAALVESPAQTRIESDSMGKIEVPANVYWGAQTQRSLLHF